MAALRAAAATDAVYLGTEADRGLAILSVMAGIRPSEHPAPAQSRR
jgi:hypothetical protein